MKINKAIELLSAFVQPGPTALDPGDQAALKLGIKALKKLQYDREPGNRPLYVKYRCHGIELRHVAVEVEEENEESAARKAMDLFRGVHESVEISHGGSWHDEDIKVMTYNEEENDWNLEPSATVTVRG